LGWLLNCRGWWGSGVGKLLLPQEHAQLATLIPSPKQCLLASQDTCRSIVQSRVGGLLQKIECTMRRVTAGECGVCAGPGADGCPERPRLLLYAGHDSNTLALLTALAQPLPAQWPDYLSVAC